MRVLLVGGEPSVTAATERAFLDAGGRARVAAEPNSSVDATALLESAGEALGGLDAVIRWTPIPHSRPLLGSGDADENDFASDIDRMLVGAQRVSAAAARFLGRTGAGSIVLVGPIDASHAYPGRSSVAAAMAGIMGLSRALGVELAAMGVRANVVLTGPIGGAPDEQGVDGQRRERTLLRSPRPSLVTPEEIAGAILFVAGPSSAFMTGQSLRVDAGWASLNQAPDGMRFP